MLRNVTTIAFIAASAFVVLVVMQISTSEAEAWDSPFYWPTMIALSFTLGVLLKRKRSRWTYPMLIGFVLTFLSLIFIRIVSTDDEGASFFAVAIVVFGPLMVFVFAISAAIGVQVGHAVTNYYNSRSKGEG